MFRITATRQYLLGLLINVALVIFLYNYSDLTYYNLQPPEGDFSENISKGTDVMTYVEPARSFVSSGRFLTDNAPDMHRTIGYPFFLAVMMKLFGDHWLIATLLAQAVLGALMYPLLSKMADLLFPEDQSLGSRVFLFSLVTGAYYATVFILLTDLTFTVFFTAGLYFGMLAIARQKWIFLIPQALFIGYAAEVRPTLLLFPLANLFILYSVAFKYKIYKNNLTKQMMVVSTVALAIVCNLPSLRNFQNYGVFKPTDAFDNNFYNDLGRDVLLEHDKARVAEMDGRIQQESDVWEKARLRREFGLAAAKDYPLDFSKILLSNAASIMFGAYTNNLGLPFGRHWKDVREEHLAPKKGSSLLAASQLFVALPLNAVMYVSFATFMIGLLRDRKYVHLVASGVVVGMFLAPAITAGNQGARLRMPVEGLIVIVSLHQLCRVPSLRKVRVASVERELHAERLSI